MLTQAKKKRVLLGGDQHKCHLDNAVQISPDYLSAVISISILSQVKFFSFSSFFVLLKDTLAADSVTLTLMSHSSFEVSAIVLLVRLQHIAANWLWMLTAGSSSRQHFSHRLSQKFQHILLRQCRYLSDQMIANMLSFFLSLPFTSIFFFISIFISPSFFRISLLSSFPSCLTFLQFLHHFQHLFSPCVFS